MPAKPGYLVAGTESFIMIATTDTVQRLLHENGLNAHNHTLFNGASCNWVDTTEPWSVRETEHEGQHCLVNPKGDPIAIVTYVRPRAYVLCAVITDCVTVYKRHQAPEAWLQAYAGLAERTQF